MRKFLTVLYGILAAACVGYYILIGIWARFGLSMSLLWPALAAVFALAAFLNARIKKKFRIAMVSVFAAVLLVFLVLFGVVASGMHAYPTGQVDYLIILGARVEQDGPSPALRRRLNAALEYLEEYPDTVVIASGGQGSDEPISEAECIQNELVAAGIPESQILLEDQSTTTEENLRYSLNLIGNPDAVVAIDTNNYHVRRAVRLAESVGFTNASGLAATYTGPTLFHYMTREAICIVVECLRGNL